MAKTKKHYSIRAYLSYLKRYKFSFLLVVFVFLISNGALAVIPVFVGQLVSALAATPVDRNGAYLFAGLLIASSVGNHITWHIAEFLYLKLIIRRNHEIGNLLFKAAIEKPYPYFIGKFTGKISSYVTQLTQEYWEFIFTICFNYISTLVKLPAIAAIMFSVNVYTGTIFLLSTCVMLMVGRYTIRPAKRMERKANDKTSTLNGYIVDVISNFVSVKAFRKTASEVDYVAHKREDVIRTSKQAFGWSMVFWISMGFLVRVILWPATILLNIWLFLEGQISLAQVTTFTTAIVVFSDYIWGVIWIISIYNLKLARMEEAYQYLFGKRNIVEEYYTEPPKEPQPAPQFDTSLSLRKLNFAYPDKSDVRVLRDISLSISKHEKIGVVGHSGSGKTTLIKLLLGYYKAPNDTVLLDGVPIDNRRLVELISYVPQDTSLFHRTIAENIAYGTEEKPDHADIEQAAKRAHAHEFIKDTPKGYQTMVGERGVKLSMGQRQRIAIARAFLDDQPLLILDEATSALDSESEKYVQEALEDLWQHKTVIAIAHRLSTLRHMDRIVVMGKGLIVESGTHQELIKKRGHYYRLWQHQHEGLIGD